MTNEFALWLSIGAGALAILFGVFSTQWILKQPAGSSRMQEISAAIQEGAKAYGWFVVQNPTHRNSSTSRRPVECIKSATRFAGKLHNRR